MTGWIIWHRAFWCVVTLLRVAFFLRGSQVERFTAATHVPEWAAVGFAVLLGLVALAMTVEGLVRQPGRFAVVGCGMMAFALNFNWADGEQEQAAVGLIVISVVVEILFYRYMSKDSTQPQVEELSN